MGRWPHQAKPTGDGFVSRWGIVVWMAGLPGWVLVAQACVRSADRPCRRERIARVPRPRHTVSRTTPPEGPIGSVAGRSRGTRLTTPPPSTRFSTRDAEDARCRWPIQPILIQEPGIPLMVNQPGHRGQQFDMAGVLATNLLRRCRSHRARPGPSTSADGILHGEPETVALR